MRVHGSQELERFEGDGGRVEKVVTKSGLEIECDFVVIGAGVHPELHLAEQAGIETDSGVLTDRYLETSAPGIFAAGDIAEYDSVVHGRRMRIEHWDVAFNHGKYAALNMLGKQQEYDVVPYFWSDLADWTSMEYVGPGERLGRDLVAGQPRRGQVHRLVREGLEARGRAHGRPLGRPRGRGEAAQGEDRHQRPARADRGSGQRHRRARLVAVAEPGLGR